jgi:hypothetical protein
MTEELREATETPEQRQARIRQAEREHDEHNKCRLASFTGVITYGAEALKGAALINGGSAAATLALISQTLEKHKALAGAMIGPLRLFGMGLLAAALASGVSYFSQMFFTRVAVFTDLTYHPPFVELGPEATTRLRIGRGLQGLAIILVFAAYCLALGYCAVGVPEPDPTRAWWLCGQEVPNDGRNSPHRY